MTRLQKKQFIGLSLLALLAIALAAAPASAVQFAYEGFDLSLADGTALNTVPASGFGFTGNWTVSNGGVESSAFRSAGLSYPGSYPGTNVAVGGHGQNTVPTGGGNSRLGLALDAAADAAVNSAGSVYISWLAERVGTTVTQDGVLDAATREAFNLASEYPRNFGMKLMDVSASNNSDLGVIGKSSVWAADAGPWGPADDYPNSPAIADTWSAAQFNDVNNLWTGPGAEFFGGVDHLVLGINTNTSRYTLWVNPDLNAVNSDGSNAPLSWIHTDNGSPVQFVLKAIGVDAGSNSSDRPGGDWVIDEIIIADSFSDAAGFVPEPSSLTLLSMLLLGCGAFRRR